MARRGLRVGELLAEGGEGRVYELPRQPHLVFKAYRRPSPRAFLDDLVAWPDAVHIPELAARVAASTAWPAATVVEDPGTDAAGVLLPRAPRRFAVRHRDGTTRLATLSYLTADPLHRAVAYGLHLPDPVGAERLGLVYALARLLEAFETANPRVGHGDLSTKNVLWSLQRGPEVFVLDCDNCERFDRAGSPVSTAGRRRAMTPNWDDPAVPGGANPTLESDRYSLALIFLRVVGAANFPIQARQRQGGPVAVDFAVPAGRMDEALLGPGAPLWGLCERGLNVAHPSQRPSPKAWVGALEAVLDTLGAADVMRAVWAAQGGGSPTAAAALPPRADQPDVVIRPVLASPRPAPKWTILEPEPAPERWGRAPAPPSVPAFGFSPAARAATGPGSLPLGTSAYGQPLGPALSISHQARLYLAEAVAWWVARHRRTGRALWTPGDRAAGARGLAVCTAVDLLVLLFGLFVVAMIVSPLLGI